MCLSNKPGSFFPFNLPPLPGDEILKKRPLNASTYFTCYDALFQQTPSNSTAFPCFMWRWYICVYICVSVFACVRVHMYMYVYVRARMYVCVFLSGWTQLGRILMNFVSSPQRHGFDILPALHLEQVSVFLLQLPEANPSATGLTETTLNLVS